MGDTPKQHAAVETLDRLHAILEASPLDTDALDEVIEEALQHEGPIAKGEIERATLKLIREKVENALTHEALAGKTEHLDRAGKLSGLLNKTRAEIERTITPAPTPDIRGEGKRAKADVMRRHIEEHDKSHGNENLVLRLLEAVKSNAEEIEFSFGTVKRDPLIAAIKEVFMLESGDKVPGEVEDLLDINLKLDDIDFLFMYLRDELIKAATLSEEQGEATLGKKEFAALCDSLGLTGILAAIQAKQPRKFQLADGTVVEVPADVLEKILRDSLVLRNGGTTPADAEALFKAVRPDKASLVRLGIQVIEEGEKKAKVILSRAKTPPVTPAQKPAVTLTKIPKALEELERKLNAKLTEIIKDKVAEARATGSDHPFCRAYFKEGKNIFKALEACQGGKPFDSEKALKEQIETVLADLEKIVTKSKTATVRPSARPERTRRDTERPKPERRDREPKARRLETDLSVFGTPALKLVFAQETESNAEDRDLMIRAWRWLGEDSEGVPALQYFHEKTGVLARQCEDRANPKDERELERLKKNARRLMAEVKTTLTPWLAERIDREKAERDLRKTVVSFYRGTNVEKNMRTLMEIAGTDVNLLADEADRDYLRRLQRSIRSLLHEEIPKTLNAKTETTKDPREKMRILRGTDLAKARGKLTEIQTRINSFSELIEPIREVLGIEEIQATEIEADVSDLKAESGEAEDEGGLPAWAFEEPGAKEEVVDADEAGVMADEDEEPAAAAEPARRPRPPRPEPGATMRRPNYPETGEAIAPKHVKELMGNVLMDKKFYKGPSEKKDPVSAAIRKVLEERSAYIDMQQLESFLRNPGPVTPEVAALETRDGANLTAELTRTTGFLQRVQEEIGDTKLELSTKGLNKEQREEIKAALAALYQERQGWEEYKAQVTEAIQRQRSAVKYASPRQALYMIYLFLYGDNSAVTEVNIEEEAEKEIAAARNDKEIGKSKTLLGYAKPTLTDTLKNLGKKDFKKITGEKMAELALAKKADAVETWIDELEGDDRVKYTQTVPKLIAYLELAIHDGNATHLNTNSREDALTLVENLKEARRQHILKVVQERNLPTPVERMAAYFTELNQATMEQAKLAAHIQEHSNYRLLKRFGLGTVAAGAVTAGMVFAPIITPIVLATAATGGGVGALGRWIRKIGQKNDPKYNPKIYRRAGWAAGGAATAGAALSATSIATALSTPGLAALSLTAWPAVAVGAAVAFAPEIIKSYVETFKAIPGKGFWKGAGKALIAAPVLTPLWLVKNLFKHKLGYGSSA